jgi:hypothetical protein
MHIEKYRTVDYLHIKGKVTNKNCPLVIIKGSI